MGKGKSSVDTQTFNKSIKLDEYGNIIKAPVNLGPRKPSVDIIIREQDDFETPPPPVLEKPPLQRQAEVDRAHVQLQQVSAPAPQPVQQVEQNQYTQMAQNYIAYQQIMNQQYQHYHQQMAQMQYAQSGAPYGYQQTPPPPVQYQYAPVTPQSTPMAPPVKQSPLPNYSMPPSIYNQPESVVVPHSAPPPPQQFQNFVSK